MKGAMVLGSLLMVAAGTADVGAQAPASPPQTARTLWQLRLQQIEKLRKAPPLDFAQALEAEFDINRNVLGFTLFAYEQGLTRELRLMEDARTDKQLSAPTTSSDASTGLTSKGAVPAILGFAVEHGALTRTTDNTSVTFRGNAIGWLDLVKGQDFISAYDDDAALVRQLRRLSYSLTFRTNAEEPDDTAARPTTEEVEAAADEAGQQLTSFSVRVTLLDQRDPRRKDNRASAQKFMDGAGADLLRATALFDPVLTSVEYADWMTRTRLALTEPSLGSVDLERVLYARLEVLRQLMITKIPDFETLLARLVKAFGTFESARLDYFKTLQKRFVMAAELVRNRAVGQPHAWTGRLIAEGKPGTTNWDITGNFALTYQDSGTALVPDPVETGGLRDVQMAFLAERPLGGACPCVSGGSGVGRPVFGVEYLGRYLTDKAVVRFAGHDFSVDREPGEDSAWIHALQARITVPVKGSGIKIPFSVSYANRTELLKEKRTFRAHFGLTLDMDVLFAAVRR